MPRKNEANLISFSVLIDTKGKLVTEKGTADISLLKDRLPAVTYSTVQTILRTADAEINKIHRTIETELDAKVYQD